MLTALSLIWRLVIHHGGAPLSVDRKIELSTNGHGHTLAYAGGNWL